MKDHERSTIVYTVYIYSLLEWKPVVERLASLKFGLYQYQSHSHLSAGQNVDLPSSHHQGVEEHGFITHDPYLSLTA